MHQFFGLFQHFKSQTGIALLKLFVGPNSHDLAAAQKIQGLLIVGLTGLLQQAGMLIKKTFIAQIVKYFAAAGAFYESTGDPGTMRFGEGFD